MYPEFREQLVSAAPDSVAGTLWQLLPEEKYKGASIPQLASINHYHQWIDACLGRGETTAGFGYSGPLTETILLGVVASHLPDARLDWDAGALAFSNSVQSNARLRRTYRDGFKVEGL